MSFTSQKTSGSQDGSRGSARSSAKNSAKNSAPKQRKQWSPAKPVIPATHIPRKQTSKRPKGAMPGWQPTSEQPETIRGMRPDVTPIMNTKLYNFRDGDPTSKNWHLNAGDVLESGSEVVDAIPVGNPRFHSFRDGDPTSKNWKVQNGDELVMSEIGRDTTPFGNNKNHNFRAPQREFYSVPKSVKPLVSYFE